MELLCFDPANSVVSLGTHIELAGSHGYLKGLRELAGNFVLDSPFLLYEYCRYLQNFCLLETVDKW